MSIHIKVVKKKNEKTLIYRAKKFINSNQNGAECIFIGRVRNKNNKKKVTGVTYDVHDKLVLKSFFSISKKAKNKFDSKAKIFIEHTKGYVKVGKISIIIAVGCNHRKESFKICRYIIEEIKYKSPIWKKEHYLKGKQKWLPGFSLRNKK